MYGAEEGTDASRRWLVDPIGGTKAFVRGVPLLYGVLVGLETEGRCEVGAAYFPTLDEMIYTATGEGCYGNGHRSRVTSTQTLEGGMLSFTDLASFDEQGREEAFRLLRIAGGSRGWSDAYGHTLVVTGMIELMPDPIMNPWNCSPFPPILREAGGYFGDWSDDEGIYAGEALSTTSALLPEVLRLIEG